MTKNRIPQYAPRNEQNGVPEDVAVGTPEITQLKALAYDTIAQMEACQGRLRQINARIAELLGVQPPAAVALPPTVEPGGE